VWVLTRADDLAKLTVLDEHGAKLQLGSLWRERPAVLVFLRHFGCIHCRSHASEIQRDKHLFDANVSVIGNGSPSFIGGFRESTGYDGPVYTDPSLAVYKAAQLKRGVTNTLDPRSLGAAFGSFMKGHKQGLQKGDQWQQGGVLVVGTDGRVLWHHASDRPGDNASPRQIIAALQSSRG
jgi:peroxiredoxin